MRTKNKDWEKNQAMTTIASFMDSYNKSIPEGFPKASTRLLRKFQAAHASLFKSADEWSIDKHRKKLMDWLSANHDQINVHQN